MFIAANGFVFPCARKRDDLIGLFKGIKNRTAHEERSLTKLLEAKKLCKESGLSKPEAMGRVGF